MNTIKKNKLFFFSGVCVVFFLAGCLQGPVVEEKQLHTPHYAVNLTAGIFDSLVVHDSDAALVEFYQPGCNVCGTMMWIIDSLALQFGDSAVVGAVNADSFPELASRFAVQGVPAYLVFQHGTPVTQRGYFRADSTAFDTLGNLLRQSIAGTLKSDMDTTGNPEDTGSGNDSVFVNYLTLDTLNFDGIVLQPERVAMVFFLYAGGLPCIHMDSVVAALLPRFRGRAVIGKVHAWEQRPLSDRYGIQWVPRFLFFKNGQEIVGERRDGVVEGDTLAAVLERLLADSLTGP